MSQLFIGWGTSPVMAMLASGILFFLIRTFIMRSSQAYQVCTRAGWALCLVLSLFRPTRGAV